MLIKVKEAFELIDLYKARKARERKQKMMKALHVLKRPGVKALLCAAAVIALGVAFWGTPFAMKNKLPSVNELAMWPDEVVMARYNPSR
jgi:hypothetical protein